VSAPDAILTAARGYIARGWPAFVLSPSKTPVANCDYCRAEHTAAPQMEACGCLTCHGFYAATRDVPRIAEMIRRHPCGLLAIRTGAPSGTVAVDVDPPHGGLPTMRQLIADGHLPRTAAQRTGSGGYHLVYAHPGVRIPSGAGKGGVGVDIKADGGYIVVAPSIHPKARRPYEWLTLPDGDLSPLPHWWVDHLREPDRPRGNVAPMPTGRKGGRYAEAALRGELERLLDAPDRQRNDTLIRAAFSLGQLVATGALDENRTADLLTWAAERIGLEPGETSRTIASGFRASAHHPRGDVA
jgi:hypothetical protein